MKLENTLYVRQSIHAVQSNIRHNIDLMACLLITYGEICNTCVTCVNNVIQNVMYRFWIIVFDFLICDYFYFSCKFATRNDKKAQKYEL